MVKRMLNAGHFGDKIRDLKNAHMSRAASISKQVKLKGIGTAPESKKRPGLSPSKTRPLIFPASGEPKTYADLPVASAAAKPSTTETSPASMALSWSHP